MNLSIPADMMPKGAVQKKAFRNGAIARFEGKPINSNPYNILGRGGFWTNWARGWVGADMGDIKKGRGL